MGAYFANGTEGDQWMAKWCAVCTHDHGDHDGSGDPYCPLVVLAMTGETVPEWTHRTGPPFYVTPDVVCSQFDPCHGAGCNGDPAPEARAAIVARVVAES